jgi:hypothetical protein
MWREIDDAGGYSARIISLRFNLIIQINLEIALATIGVSAPDCSKL